MELIFAVAIRNDVDLVASRIRSREVAGACGFPLPAQVLISGIVTEITRDIFIQTFACELHFFLQMSLGVRQLAITVSGATTSIQSAESILGVAAAKGKVLEAGRRFMDHFDVRDDGRTQLIKMVKALPKQHVFSMVDLLEKVSDFAPLPTNVALSQAYRHNDGLKEVLAAVSAREAKLLSESEKLGATNRNVSKLNGVLSETAAALSLADRRKDEFLSTLSHELRGPLSATGMALQLLQLNPGDAALTLRVSHIIARQVEQISRLVEDLLDVSRVSRGLLSINLEALNFKEVLASAHEQMMPAIQHKCHVLTMTLPPSPCFVHGDKARLVQVFSNLIGNAVRYTQDGGKIHVILSVESDELVVRVVDNGSGIPAVLMPHLFDMYVQAERSSDRLGGGLGLGLPLVKSLVAAHSGSVSALSDGAGFGSTFTVRLPRQPSHWPVR